MNNVSDTDATGTGLESQREDATGDKFELADLVTRDVIEKTRACNTRFGRE